MHEAGALKTPSGKRFNYLQLFGVGPGIRRLQVSGLFLLLLGIIVDSRRKRIGKGSGIEFIRQTLFWVLITHSRIRKWNALKVDWRSFKERWDRNFNWQKAFRSLTALAGMKSSQRFLKDEPVNWSPWWRGGRC